ncbi:hypothetical protein PPUN109347_08090 [Pseudomonas putida]|nr:hypothetical protein PPUN109347_08090 [Pseudomonas putida]
MGAGMPAKNATRCMAPAAPVFAAEAAPTGTVQTSSFTQLPQNITHLRAASLIVNINVRGFVGDGIYLFY